MVGRSLDRSNDRLSRLFHAGYIDRPRAQLDYYPDRGGGPMVYALADRGARLLIERDGSMFSNLEWSRKNRQAGRPFIEHQLEIMDFYVGLQLAAKPRDDVAIIHPDELVVSFPDQVFSANNPFALQTRVNHHGIMVNVGIVPDLVFGLRFPDGSRRCFMVEIDRGTIPIVRANLMQTSFDRKMRAYLSAHTARQHERHFGWKTFRVLTVTTDINRIESMREALADIHVPNSTGPSLFFFCDPRRTALLRSAAAHLDQRRRPQRFAALSAFDSIPFPSTVATDPAISDEFAIRAGRPEAVSSLAPAHAGHRNPS